MNHELCRNLTDGGNIQPWAAATAILFLPMTPHSQGCIKCPAMAHAGIIIMLRRGHPRTAKLLVPPARLVNTLLQSASAVPPRWVPKVGLFLALSLLYYHYLAWSYLMHCPRIFGLHYPACISPPASSPLPFAVFALISWAFPGSYLLVCWGVTPVFMYLRPSFPPPPPHHYNFITLSTTVPIVAGAGRLALWLPRCASLERRASLSPAQGVGLAA